MVEQTITKAKLSYRMRESFTRSIPEPTTYMTMRDHFDNLLAQRAVSAGVTLIDGAKVDRIEADGPVSRVYSGQDVFSGSVLVGADGANSVVAHQLGLMRNAEIGVGLESEVYPGPGYLEPWKAMLSIDFGTIRGGYMWVFPKKDHLSIGVASFARYSTQLRRLLGTYLGSLELGGYEQRLTRGHRLPRRRKGAPIQKGNALLVGDAAGLMDFWTGEGIYYAIRSAQLAAPAIGEFLEGGATDIREYETRVDAQLMPELRIARTMARMSVWFPKLGYELMKRSDRVWNLGCRILRAERTYHDVPMTRGPLGFLFRLMGAGT